MALDLLASCANETIETVLDIGTGTGILAIAGCLFGVQKGVAIDNDLDAVRAATENVKKNGLAERISVSDTLLENVQEAYPIICANIIHDTLVEMAKNITRLSASGCSLILAGILAGEQEQNIIRVYGQLGFSLVKTSYQDEWAALLLSFEK
jgi:ribosomal protein L11 methyltransferase